MTPEAEEAPIDHIKISSTDKEEVLRKLYNRRAFDESSALEKNEMQLDNELIYALYNLIERKIVLKVTTGSGEKYYINKNMLPKKHYRKQVVMGLSIPVLLFLITIILAGLIAIIIQLIRSF